MNARLPSRPAWLLLTLLAAILAGCGRSGPVTVPVTGTVTLEGKPVSGAAVMLTPAASGMPAYGTTDQEGHFSLSSGPSRNGAGPGQYTAIVTLAKTSGIAVNSDQLEGEVSPGGIRIESIVPPKYSDPKTSGLSVDVQTGMPPLKFDLSTHQ